jgi:2',3'-cyclic-nucleotide 2'-phosphodiesterase / 3'-nucleotidase
VTPTPPSEFPQRIRKSNGSLRSKPTAQGHIQLRLLATSDLHMHLMAFDYYSNTPTDKLGLVRTASLIRQARAEVPNCLLFDNGDFLQGSPMGHFCAQDDWLKPGAVHPIFSAMNHLGYDAGTLGNHEFNYGLDFLHLTLEGAAFPIVSANVHLVQGNPVAKSLVPPYVILERVVTDSDGAFHRLKIGVIGFTPPQILIWDHRHLAGKLTTSDCFDAAKSAIPEMKRAGADIIVALSHSGIGPSDPAPGLEHAAAALARLAGIDVVIAGHAHLVFPSPDFAATDDIDPVRGTLCNKPAVMPGFNGSHLGVIDLFLSHHDGQFKIISHQSEARPIWNGHADGSGTALVENDTGVEQVISAVHRDVLKWVEKPIGRSAIPLHSFFALVTDAPALQIVAAAQIQHTQNHLPATIFADLPILSSVAPFKAGGRGGPENYTDVLAGDIQLRHAADLYIHPNTAAAVCLTGAQVAGWLEHAVGLFNQIIPGSSDAPLINPDFPSFNFELIFGLTFQIDLSQPPRFDQRGTLINPSSQRITDLRYQDTPINPAAYFVVATNSYRIETNNSYLPFAAGQVIFRSTESNLDLVQNYFATNPVEKAFAGPSRRFVALKNTSVTFETSPKAVRYLSDLVDLNIEPIELLPSGFMRFRLHL